MSFEILIFVKNNTSKIASFISLLERGFHLPILFKQHFCIFYLADKS